MAKALGMSKVFVHRYGGILSAYGLSMADAVREEQVSLTCDIYWCAFMLLPYTLGLLMGFMIPN